LTDGSPAGGPLVVKGLCVMPLPGDGLRYSLDVALRGNRCS